MRRPFTLETWKDGDWFVGRLIEVPGVFSQGETMEELQENIQDAYELMVTQERTDAPADSTRWSGWHRPTRPVAPPSSSTTCAGSGWRRLRGPSRK